MSRGLPEDYDSSSCFETNTTTDSISDVEAPPFSPLTLEPLSEDDCDGSEGCLSITEQGTGMPSGSAATDVNDLDSVKESQSHGSLRL